MSMTSELFVTAKQGRTREHARLGSQRCGANEREEIRATIERLSRWMDSMFVLPVLGWRFGFDAIMGLIPGLGDVATTLVSLYIVTLSSRAGMPKITLARMALNVGIDFVLGGLPLIGDVMDVWWKANQMNAALLRERLAARDFQTRRATVRDWLFVGAMVVLLLVLFAGVLLTAGWIASALWNAASALITR
ncbi:MAG TPA: DUF4112 domain-containing protein [Pirellulales bacterium]|nr:DUF4112 domain-containing protein [Pirellulales bacterium]